ncbi:hypothetical protein [Coprobacter fastidiosus]|jgi:hypothetical protein|uniref:hypothetical protein n=1 Tax=Coprobacter fastidiosus TaxID=1099853 RepID=UPI0020505143|nr:hypothetical protein [Coprobacter fastidiosus]DAZ61663.1 MAG TPA: hypothetical protein [Caudoviricetes sp.]
MKKKLLTLLTGKCKDMGLTEKALGELVELGSEGLSDDASDEDIVKKVDSLVPFAKAMQAEITRKTQKKQSTTKQSTEEEEGNGEGENKGGNDVPEWFKTEMQKRDKQISDLIKENETLKANETKKSRSEQIAAKAKELGIPDFLMKRFSIADDADIEKELTEYAQDLVNNKLMSKDSAHELSSSEEAMRKEAKAWAESLPNN